MNAEEALALANSEEVIKKIKAQKQANCQYALKEMLARIKGASLNNETYIIYPWSSDTDFDAFEILRTEKNYKIYTVWYHPLSQVKISWKHALTKPANDVMKGLVGKPTMWERFKGWFK